MKFNKFFVNWLKCLAIVMVAAIVVRIFVAAL